SAIETALELSEGQLRGEEMREILRLAHEMLDHPVEVLPHARETIGALASNHRLLLITKGDLRDQERKIGKSGLADRFQAVEIVSEKDVRSYDRILRRHGVTASEFLMVGNSIKSDILPVLELGGWAVHVPYPFTWEHERVDTLPEDPR